MCIMLYSKRDGEWIKRARENSSGAQTAYEEFCHASPGRDEDSSGPLICLWVKSLFSLSNTQMEEVNNSLTPAGPSIW